MDKIKLGSFLIVFLLAFATLLLHMVPAVFCGMLIYLLTKSLSERVARHIPNAMSATSRRIPSRRC